MSCFQKKFKMLCDNEHIPLKAVCHACINIDLSGFIYYKDDWAPKLEMGYVTLTTPLSRVVC